MVDLGGVVALHGGGGVVEGGQEILPDVADLPGFFANNAGVLLEGGNDLFVGNAEGYVRLNLAMPRSIIKTGLERMTEAIEKHNK